MFVHLSGMPQCAEHCNTEHGHDPTTTGNATAITTADTPTTLTTVHGVFNAGEIIVSYVHAGYFLTVFFFSESTIMFRPGNYYFG